MESLFQEVQNLFYSQTLASKSDNLLEKIKDVELVMFENGISESNMYVNWLKLYYSRQLFNEGKRDQAT